jgi:hypothetical protein
MEVSVLDNEFLSLFFPENSDFSNDDILEEYKYFIFIIMKSSSDALIQEKVFK